MVSAEKNSSQEDGEKFNAQPQITVKTKSGNVIDAKIDTLKQEGLFPQLILLTILLNIMLQMRQLRFQL